MTPEELAAEIRTEVARVGELCADRATGIGAQQYYVPGQPQKFETMALDALAEYYEEELRDIVNYAVMTHIRLRRLRDEVKSRSAYWESIPFAVEEIGKWAESTFQHNNDGILRHLAEEVDELQEADEACHTDKMFDNVADIAILLLTFCYRNRISLPLALGIKHEINLGRSWKFDPDTKLTRHV